jgi:SAM-dependent methyltransferase
MPPLAYDAAAASVAPSGLASVERSFVCPACRGPLEAVHPDELRCPADGTSYRRVDGIWRFLSPERAAYFAPFLRDYTAIRGAEGYGYDDPARYRRLPEADPADPLAWQWRMRARSFACLRRRVLPRHAGISALDLGAGIGWLSSRLAELGHYPCAVDLNLDSRDGLGAARHYTRSWPRIQAEFDRLPLPSGHADLVLYNASLHYSLDYRATLAEGLRVLRPNGRIVVMDSPIYRRDASGRQMIAERQAAFERDHGTRSDALPSVGYLTWAMLRDLAADLGLRWRIFRPWYGWRWALRPWRARLAGKREPSTFALLVAERSAHRGTV